MWKYHWARAGRDERGKISRGAFTKYSPFRKERAAGWAGGRLLAGNSIIIIIMKQPTTALPWTMVFLVILAMCNLLWRIRVVAQFHTKQISAEEDGSNTARRTSKASRNEWRNPLSTKRFIWWIMVLKEDSKTIGFDMVSKGTSKSLVQWHQLRRLYNKTCWFDLTGISITNVRRVCVFVAWSSVFLRGD